MNEVKHIHLGRQSFTISVDAYKALQDYLNAIKQQVDDTSKDVIEEVELRMAELLTERGMTTKKVILEKDIAFLKDQLGEPRDFKEDTSDEDSTEPRGTAESPKRLYRDVDNAMLAGVASGLAAYIGIDTVIVRIIFVALTFFGGSGALIYILLWLLVPETVSKSDRLQMQGKPVTIESLKKIVDDADVPGATRRAHKVLWRIGSIISRVFLVIIGLLVAITASGLLLGTMASSIYVLTNHVTVQNVTLLPIGVSETVAVIAAALFLLVFAFTLLLIGIAMIRRKWQLPGWGVATAVGIMFISLAITGAFITPTIQQVRNRFDSIRHTSQVSFTRFTSVNLLGPDTKYVFIPSSDNQYSVTLQYVGSIDTSHISYKNMNGQLSIDTTNFTDQNTCGNIGFCLYNDTDLQVTIHAPKLDTVSINGKDAQFEVPQPLMQTALTVDASSDAMLELSNMAPDAVQLTASKDGNQHLVISGINPGVANGDTITTDDDGTVAIDQVTNLAITTPDTCSTDAPLITVVSQPSTLTINGKKEPTIATAYHALQSDEAHTDVNCVLVN